MKLFRYVFLLLLLPATTQAMNNDPVDFIRMTTERVLSELDKTADIKSSPEQLRSLVEANVSPNIDFTRLSGLILGKHWKTASAGQRTQFTKGFKQLLLNTYSTSLAEYTGQKIEHRLLKMAAGGRRATVRTEFTPSAGTPVIVDYRLHHIGDHWKIYDVSIEGISLAVNYRSSFSHEINNHGLDSLIQQLTERY